MSNQALCLIKFSVLFSGNSDLELINIVDHGCQELLTIRSLSQSVALSVYVFRYATCIITLKQSLFLVCSFVHVVIAFFFLGQSLFIYQVYSCTKIVRIMLKKLSILFKRSLHMIMNVIGVILII